MVSGTYTQVANATISNALTASFVTTNVIFVTITGHGVTIGQPVWLQFPHRRRFQWNLPGRLQHQRQ